MTGLPVVDPRTDALQAFERCGFPEIVPGYVTRPDPAENGQQPPHWDIFESR